MNTENIDKSLFEFAAFDELESEHIAAPRYSYWKSVFRVFFRKKTKPIFHRRWSFQGLLSQDTT